MTITLIAIYFFIAGLTAEYTSSTFKKVKASRQERWCLSLFCGLMWPLCLFVFLINR